MDACIVSFKNVVVAETQNIDFTSAVVWWPAESVPRILFPSYRLVVRNVVQHDVCLLAVFERRLYSSPGRYSGARFRTVADENKARIPEVMLSLVRVGSVTGKYVAAL